LFAVISIFIPVTYEHHTREKAFGIFGTEYTVHAGLFYPEQLLTYIVLHVVIIKNYYCMDLSETVEIIGNMKKYLTGEPFVFSRDS
jgi:hypothetical protein